MNELLAEIARTFAMLSLVSIGGVNALLPEIHRQVVEVHGWMDDAAFANVFAISNAAPGPNVILVSLVGWQVAGLAGLLVATLAIMIPSCTLAFVVSRAVARMEGRTWLALVRAGLVPVALGLMLAAGLAMMRTADRDILTVAISLATAAFVVLTSRNPLWAFAAATVVNIAGLYAVGSL